MASAALPAHNVIIARQPRQAPAPLRCGVACYSSQLSKLSSWPSENEVSAGTRCLTRSGCVDVSEA
jgi:hypothetical protein